MSFYRLLSCFFLPSIVAKRKANLKLPFFSASERGARVARSLFALLAALDSIRFSFLFRLRSVRDVAAIASFPLISPREGAKKEERDPA